jgi:hypothetical protein
MDFRKRCKVSSTCWHFLFAQCAIEFDLAIGERIPTCHRTFQSKNYQINCVGNSNFHNQKDNGQDVKHTKNWYHYDADQVNQIEG